MDINMKNITLGRLEGTKWITIDEKDLSGKVVNQTKLLYDDPADGLSLEDYQEQMAKLSVMQELERAGDLIDGLDFLLTGGEAIVGAGKVKATLKTADGREQTKEISTTMGNFIKNYKNNDNSKTVSSALENNDKCMLVEAGF